jgi:hypothetical protein
MTQAISDLDLAEVTTDQTCGLVGGARGVVVAIHGTSATLEFLDGIGYTIGLFEVPLTDLRRVEPLVSDASVARED